MTKNIFASPKARRKCLCRNVLWARACFSVPSVQVIWSLHVRLCYYFIPLGIALKGLDPWFCSYKPCLPAPPPKTSLQNQVPADFTTSQLSTKWGGQPFFSNHKPSERAPSPPARYPKLLYEIRNLAGKQQCKIDELLSLSEERPFCRGSICWFLALLLRLKKWLKILIL